MSCDPGVMKYLFARFLLVAVVLVVVAVVVMLVGGIDYFSTYPSIQRSSLFYGIVIPAPRDPPHRRASIEGGRNRVQ